MIPAEELCGVFVEVSDTLVADFGLLDFLYHLSEHAARICEASAVGILLADETGTLHYAAASTEQVQLVELFQIQHFQGPCFDCFQHGEPVVNADLATAAARWPEFAPLAVEAGFRSVHAIPMRLRGQIIGTVNIFHSNVGHFEIADILVVQALADVATIAILQARSVHRAEILSKQLQEALNSRIMIEQAKGALSRLRGVDTDQAFVLMRTYAREHRRRLENVAQAVVDDPASVSTLVGADG